MKKLLVLPAVLLLTGCTVMDIVGPRANGEIMALAKQASADWVFSSDDHAEWREMRKFHATQLRDEALRLCGTDSHGATPSSCDVNYGDTDLPAASDVDALLSGTVVAADKVPDDSVDLIVAQAIDALALHPVDLSSVDAQLTDPEDLSAARDMLSRENAAYYGFGLALAYADEPLRDRIAVLRKASRERADALTRVLGDDLAPAAGYSFADGYPEPTSVDEAAQLVRTLQDDLVKEWRFVAAGARSGEFREDGIRLAAHAQRS